MGKTRKDLLNDTNKLNTIYLQPGEICCAEKPSLVHTVLGSCISILFYYKNSLLSIINHAQMPERNNSNSKCFDSCPVKCMNWCDDSCDNKFVTCSFNNMMNELEKRYILKNEIDVKLFGGANVLPFNAAKKTIGEENVDIALELIYKNKLNLVKKDIGGNTGRTLYFYTDSGKVFLSRFEKKEKIP